MTLQGKAGDHHRAIKHVIIGAKAGHEKSLDMVVRALIEGLISNDEYMDIFRKYQSVRNETKSAARDEAAEMVAVLNENNERRHRNNR